MARCKFCGQEIDWITSMEGKQVPVDPDPVFVIEDDGPDTFLDDMGAAITGRQATPEEERRDLPVAFVPHRQTCPWADKPTQRRVEYGADAGGLAPATQQHVARLKPYDHKSTVEMLEEARREYEGAMDRIYTVAKLTSKDAEEMEREARLLAAATTMTIADAMYHVGLMLQLVELAHELGYTDTKRMGTWTKRILDVKYMCLAWLKKDTERAKAIHTSRQRADCDTMVKLVREILAAEAANK